MEELSASLWQAATIMLTGMVVVFVFLSSLIVLVRILATFFAPKITDEHEIIKSEILTTNSTVSPEKVAVISAAIAQYRQRYFAK
jgi:oxaloacetate decarboxylase gamma subunit